MTANPARRASCDGEGCEATFQIERGDDARWALEWAGWQMSLMDDRGTTWVFCPDHKQPWCTDEIHFLPHRGCLLR